jgi:UDP-glucose 4-epimerase
VILVTGGFGFIGRHTTRALLDLGESCVVGQRRVGTIPEFLAPDLGGRLLVEGLDVGRRAELERIGRTHPITGIVHLADATATRLWRRPGENAPVALSGLFDGLTNVLEAAREWDVPRVTLASTIGVYGGLAPGLWNEATPLPQRALHAIPTAKRCSELLGAFLGGEFGVEVVSVRPSAIWGPGGRAASSFFALPGLVHAALGLGPPPEQPVYADDAGDLCYVRDCARAIALVQSASALNHTLYNIGSGRLTTNQEIVTALERNVPGTTLRLRAGRTPGSAPPDPLLDLTRLREDTGYTSEYDVDRGIAEYVESLQSAASHLSS